MNEEPLVSVLRGAPTPEELAALVGVLATRSTPTNAKTPQKITTPWTRSARPAANPTSWRDSDLPH
jgi:hypothetical protein